MNSKVKIVAEAGCNHNGNISLAFKLIDQAKKTKADAIKFQLFTADQTVTKKAKKASYALQVTNKKETQYQMQKKLELTNEEHFNLKKYCSKKGIEYLCSAFDLPSLLFLKKLRLKEFKIPSGEIVNLPYLKLIASFKRNVVLSTGMSTISEIRKALSVLFHHGLKRNQVSLLQCNSEYPTPFEDVNLKGMIFLKDKFRLNTGISDHTLGIEIPIAAVALGACYVEKHFTLSRKMVGPDHQASITPLELEKMVNCIRNTEKSLGYYGKKVTKSEKKNIKIARKSLVALKKIKKGKKFNKENLGMKRPGTGISPMKYDFYIGKKSKKNYKVEDTIK